MAGVAGQLLAAAALLSAPTMIWRGWEGAATWSPALAVVLATLAGLLLADAVLRAAVVLRRLRATARSRR